MSGRVRDYLEQQRWYWFSINLSFNVFPWHWQMDWEKHKFWFKAHFGPFGILIIWE